jgi:hypothetical protein
VLSDNWSVIQNCIEVEEGEELTCFCDLEKQCNAVGGVYYDQAVPQMNGGKVISVPSCAFPSPYSSLNNCDANGTCTQWPTVGLERDEGAYFETTYVCPDDQLFNGGYSCLLQGDWTLVTNLDTPTQCNGILAGNTCAFNGTWTTVSTSSTNLLSMITNCTKNGAVTFDEGSGCVLPDLWTLLTCHTSNPCTYPSSKCNGFMIDEGCVQPGVWEVLSECPIDGLECEDNDCHWSQCEQIKGTLLNENIY